MSFMYDYMCCRKCMNNPFNNPYASGICNCVLPSMEMMKYVSSEEPYLSNPWLRQPRPYRDYSEWIYETYGIKNTYDKWGMHL